MSDIISVIVPVYKVEKYINKCIDSILEQSYSELDIILVDDGSPDNCGVICDDYAKRDKRIRVIHKKNGGLSSARNAALNDLKGKWVVCIDSDDYVHKDLIKRLYEAAKQYNADISICSHFEQEGDKLQITERIDDETQIFNRHDALLKLVEDKEIKSYAWGKLYKKELFDGVRYPDGRNYEDIATTYLLFDKAERVVKIPDYLYYYLIREDGISFNSSTAAWHKGCHATCLGQEERASYFKDNGYTDLYERSMAKLLPYLYSDIRSGYIVSANTDIAEAKLYIKNHEYDFLNNKIVDEKDKKLLSVYLMNKRIFSLYIKSKKLYKKCIQNIRKIKKRITTSDFCDFSLQAGKTKRIVYFELPCFDNLGDHAIAFVSEQILETKCKEFKEYQLFIVDGWDTDRAIKSLRKHILPNDVIVCQGGGNFGSLYEFAEVFRRKVLKAFRNNKIIIMPQTVFYSDDDKGRRELNADKKIIKGCNDITIFVRDAKSYELMKQYFECTVEQLHDVVSFFDAKYLCEKEKNGIIVCLRSDKESALNAKDKKNIIDICERITDKALVTDTCVKYEVTSKMRREILEKKIKLFGSARLVITDRLHGMIFSVITGTPCIVIGNNHHKVYETYKTFSDCKYIRFVPSLDGLEKKIQDMLNLKIDNQNKVFDKDIDILVRKLFY
ncbi:glycosyltransferase [Butyrivibrio sp. LC3010]|uniref:glycosyltransferase n=1 Tax=Butyrivibrio sp. LC3010 TaxID=1280680 RepID=UPI0003F7155F|nr:glycosyltransferase [Butyrivibrio sp. LC3010]